MIRWITPTLGTSAWSTDLERGAYSVVDVRGLLDRRGNANPEILELVTEAQELLGAGQKVVICCDHGISRSNAIAAAVLARIEGIAYGSALLRVIESTGERQIKLEVADDIRAAIEARPSPTTTGVDDGRVLVTGAMGFVGRYLLGTIPSAIAIQGEPDILANPIRLQEAVHSREVRCIVHTARPSVADANEGLGASIVVLRNILEVCGSLQVKLIFLSGHQVFAGYGSDILRADESHPPLPSGAVGEGFYLCERLIDLHTRRDGLRSLIVRACTLYGPGDERRHFLNTFVQRAAKGEDVEVHRYRDGAPVVEILHINDFATGLRMAIQAHMTGILHLGSGSPIDTPTLAALVCELSGTGAQVRQRNIARNVANVILDSSLARRALNWHPEISLDAGLGKLVTNDTNSRSGT